MKNSELSKFEHDEKAFSANRFGDFEKAWFSILFFACPILRKAFLLFQKQHNIDYAAERKKIKCILT